MPKDRKTYHLKSNAKKHRKMGERVVKYGRGYQLRKVRCSRCGGMHHHSYHRR